MSAAWRLATNSLSGRRRRAALLAGAVALSAALITCIASAMASIHRAINTELSETVGSADARIRPAASLALVPHKLLDEVRQWPGVRRAEGKLTGNLSLNWKLVYLAPPLPGSPPGFRRGIPYIDTTSQALSIDAEQSLTPAPKLLAGRLPTADDEIAIDSLTAFCFSYECRFEMSTKTSYILFPPSSFLDRLNEPSLPLPAVEHDAAAARRFNLAQHIRVGDNLDVVKQSFPGLTLPALRGYAKRTKLKVVGIVAQPPLGGRSRCYLTLPALASLTAQQGLSEISIGLDADEPPDAFVAANKTKIPAGVLLQTTERVTSGLDKNMQSNQLGMILATVMAFLSASFIILTGLTTSLAERQRELAMIRCIGGTRAQLAKAQLLIGLFLGALGAFAGVPLGIGIAALLAYIFRAELSTGLAVPWWAPFLGLVGSFSAGLIGAIWPAWRASRLSPLEGLASRAALPRPRGLKIITLAGLMCLLYQVLVVGIPTDGQFIFWAYATVGLPLMFIGYFMLGVPACLIITRLAAAPISRLLRLPPRLLSRTVEATPYRHGLTAGALMAGLALMVGIWTDGTSILRDWLDKIQFPDAFVSGVLSESDRQILDNLKTTVASTAAITLHPVEVDLFGVRAIQKYKTMFIGFEPRQFLSMTRLTWVQGDPETAIRKLEAGGAVIVAREFLAAQGLGVGGKFTCSQDNIKHEFEIVGVVSSPGLEIASKFFNVGEDLTDQSIHAVFGSREDLKAKFFGGENALPVPIHLIQIQLTPEALEAGDESSLGRIRSELMSRGSGFLDAGSGRQLKDQVRTFAKGAILVFTSIAIIGMLIACCGVANIIIAGIDARQFEFGVLRAVGAQRSLLTRLIVGEALLIALAACILGTCMGLQGSWAGQRLNRLLLGLEMTIRPPLLPVALSWLALILLTLAAALPAILRLHTKRPRDLLAATKG